MNELETKFSQSQTLQLLIWFRYINVFFIRTNSKDKFGKLLEDLNSFDNNIKYAHQSSKENVTYLDLIVKI